MAVKALLLLFALSPAPATAPDSCAENQDSCAALQHDSHDQMSAMQMIVEKEDTQQDPQTLVQTETSEANRAIPGIITTGSEQLGIITIKELQLGIITTNGIRFNRKRIKIIPYETGSSLGLARIYARKANGQGVDIGSISANGITFIHDIVISHDEDHIPQLDLTFKGEAFGNITYHGISLGDNAQFCNRPDEGMIIGSGTACGEKLGEITTHPPRIILSQNGIITTSGALIEEAATQQAEKLKFQDTPLLTSLWRATKDADNDGIDRLLDRSQYAVSAQASDGRGPAWWGFELQNAYALGAILAYDGQIVSEDEDLQGQTALSMCTDNPDCNADALIAKARELSVDIKKRREEREKENEIAF